MMDQQKQKALNQLKTEFQDINSNPIANIGVSVGLVNDNLFEWQATMIGPADTPYKNGLFILSVKFPDDYPQTKPDVRFKTPIYHVNVNPTSEFGIDIGHVCISTLNSWTPERKMREVFTDIFALFYVGNPNSAYGFEAGPEMINNRKLYDEKAKFFTRKYANPARSVKISDKNWDFSYKK